MDDIFTYALVFLKASLAIPVFFGIVVLAFGLLIALTRLFRDTGWSDEAKKSAQWFVRCAFGFAVFVCLRFLWAPPVSQTHSYVREVSYRTGAVCQDGSLSRATGSGACSLHDGVDYWLYTETVSVTDTVPALLEDRQGRRRDAAWAVFGMAVLASAGIVAGRRGKLNGSQ
jgi:hypothetical protein